MRVRSFHSLVSVSSAKFDRDVGLLRDRSIVQF